MCVLEERLNQSIHAKKLTGKKRNFLTNLEGLEFFDKLHDVIALLLQKKQEKRKVSQHEKRWIGYHQKATIKM